METSHAHRNRVGRGFQTLDEIQRDHIVAVLAACDGQIAGSGGAAEVLGVHPNTLRSRLKKLGITARKEASSRHFVTIFRVSGESQSLSTPNSSPSELNESRFDLSCLWADRRRC